MVNFIVFDIAFLILFTLFVIVFLYTRKHNLKREGIIYLYRTKLGIDAIEWTSKKFGKALHFIKYLVIISGFILMISIVAMLLFSTYLYLKQPSDSALARIPAVAPVIPYFPQLFNFDSVFPFPPFYFTYFILAIAIVAISHEFAHGIYARLFKIKIHSTGFAFLGPILGAFVEQDDKQMKKAHKLEQMVVLAAGTFANLVMVVVFGILMVLFFSAAFTPSGLIVQSYAASFLPVNEVSIQGIPFSSFNSSFLDSNETFLEVKAGNSTYFVPPAILLSAQQKNAEAFIAFDDTPARATGLKGVILELDNTKITSQQVLIDSLARHNPGDTIIVKTLSNNEIKEHEVTLAERDGKSYLGIATMPPYKKNAFGAIYTLFGQKQPSIYYESILGSSGQFIFDLLWWIVIINILVALFNMYPAGILDGGRFLMLAVWGATNNQKAGEKVLSFMTWLFLAIIIILMIKWVFAFI